MKSNVSAWFGLSSESKDTGTPLSIALPTKQKVIIVIALGCVCVLLFVFTQHVDSKILGAMLAVSVFLNVLALLSQVTIHKITPASTEY